MQFGDACILIFMVKKLGVTEIPMLLKAVEGLLNAKDTVTPLRRTPNHLLR